MGVGLGLGTTVGEGDGVGDTLGDGSGEGVGLLDGLGVSPGLGLGVAPGPGPPSEEDDELQPARANISPASANGASAVFMETGHQNDGLSLAGGAPQILTKI
jgi:hypothetical protein